MTKNKIYTFFSLFFFFGFTTFSYAGEMVTITIGEKLQKELKKHAKSEGSFQKSFLIDKNEATLQDYHLCTQRKKCKEYIMVKKNIKEYKNYPVTEIRWIDAQQYCSSLGKRLPTEYEWMAAALQIGKKYPWGNEKITKKHVNYCDARCRSSWRDPYINDGYKHTAPVGSYPKGRTKQNVNDLAGNVWEWTSTIKSTGKKLQYKNRALSQDELKFSMVIKGGSYGSAAKHLDPRFRSVSQIVYQSRFLGFRCVKKP